SAFWRQSQPRHHLRRLSLLLRAGGFHFFIERDCFRSVPASGAVFFVLVGGIPVYERLGDFLPVVALDTKKSDAVTSQLPLGSELIRTVFEDDALGLGLGVAG